MKRIKIILLILAAAVFALAVFPVQSSAVGEAIAIAVEVDSFSSANTSGSSGNTLLLSTGTTTTTGGKLRLTQNTNSQAGTVVRRNQIKLTNGFSTFFQFMITSTTTPADGLSFIVYKSNTALTGEAGSGIGYAGIGNSIVVEFDTYNNPEMSDLSSPHVAIMTNGSASHSNQPSGSRATYSSLTSGSTIYCWVDYDGNTVTATYGTSATRSSGSNSTITRAVGSALVGSNVFMGFSASTGGCYSYHDITKWYFKDAYVSGGLSSNPSAYAQAASTVGVTLNSATDPAYATVKLYNASGAAISGNLDIYFDEVLQQSDVSVDASGYNYSLPTNLGNGSHTIRAVADGGTSNFASFTVTAVAPTISSNPSSQSVYVGDTATLGVSATSPDGGSLTYKWQVYSNSVWSDISGAMNASYTTGALLAADSGKQYRCVVTNTNGSKVASANSSAATLTVSRRAGTVTITGDASKIYDGTAVSGPAVSKNGNGAVTYIYYTDNSGSIGSQLADAPADAGTYWVRAEVAQCDAYTAATASKKFTISSNSLDTADEAKLALSYSLNDVAYNGSPQPVSVTTASGVSGLGGITVYYEGTGDTVYVKSMTAPTDAGVYTISVDIAEGSNYGSYNGLVLGDYTINRIAITGITDDDYSCIYDGNEYSIALDGVPSDAMVVYRVNSSGAYDLTSLPTFTDAGTYTVDYIVTKDNYLDFTGSAQVIIDKKVFTPAMVEEIFGTFTYNGSAQTPSPVVTDGLPSIISATDYTVTYENNTDCGKATVIAAATDGGNYTGTVSKTFTIVQKELTVDMIADIDAVIYSGSAHTPKLTVTDGTPGAITAADYTVSYANNVNAGIATVTITATVDGNYTGMVSVPYTIMGKALSTSMISDIAVVTFNGFAQTPELTVTDGTPSAIATADYMVSYANNVNAGTATVTITATADGNYTDKAAKTFTINKKQLLSAMVRDIDSLVYTGEALKPNVTVKDGTPSIINTSDYSVSYSDNKNAGLATVKVTTTITGNYSGSVTKEFFISGATIEGKVIVPGSVKNGAVIQADITGISPSEARTGLTYQWKRNGNVITGATSASYKATADDVSNTLTVMVTGKGNYTGSITSSGVSVSAMSTTSPITLAAPVFDGDTVTIGGSVGSLGGSYTANISIMPQTGGSWDVLKSGTYSSENSLSVDLSNLKPGTVYIYRMTVEIDGQTYTKTGRFLTPADSGSDSAATGSISGSVRDNTGMGTLISVTIEKGNTVIGSRTGLKNGSTFTFTELPNGIYNMVASNGSYRVTQIITVKNGEAVDNVIMSIEKKQSLVTVITEYTPDIAVGGLNELFQYDSMFTASDAQTVDDGGTVEFNLNAERMDESSVDNTSLLETASDNEQFAMYMDISLIKTVYDRDGNEIDQTSLSEIASLLEVVIPIPDDLKGKGKLTIYRMHNDVAEALPEGYENANAHGEYFTIEGDYITMYVKNFCLFATAYTEGMAAENCVIHWWLLAILIMLIVVGTAITLRNAKRIHKAKEGVEI